MSTHVVDAGVGARDVILGRRIIHGIYADRPPLNLLAKRVNKNLANVADARWLPGASSENHLDVGAWISCRSGKRDASS
jgi:hypothetical protein